MSRKIPSERNFLHRAGTVLLVVGGLLFASVFVTAALHFEDFRHLAGKGQTALLRAFGGMVLVIVGAILRGIGTRGLADSGMLLDPERARRELEPPAEDPPSHYEPPWKGPE